MIREHDESPTGLEEICRLGKGGGDLLEFLVDLDADGLERSSRRMCATATARYRPRHDGGQLVGGGDRRARPGPGDGAGDAPRESLLSVLCDDGGQAVLRIGVHHVRRGEPRLVRVHPHVERPAGPIAEPAAGLVELHRRDTQVEQDPSSSIHSRFPDGLAQSREVRSDGSEPLTEPGQPRRSFASRGFVAVHPQDRPDARLQKGFGMASGSNGRVHHDRLPRQELHDLGDHDRPVGASQAAGWPASPGPCNRPRWWPEGP